jgi:hypothetical protein
MLKRTMTAALMITLVITAGSVSAQCVVGVYADAAGTESVTAPTQFVPFDIYVILRDQAAVEGMSYKLTMPATVFSVGGDDPLNPAPWFGPNEAGFVFPTPQGVIVGFGECAIGFGGNDIQIAHYLGFATDGSLTNAEVTLEPNRDESLTNVQYATCSGQVVDCGLTQNLLLTHVVGTESKSFGAVKSLY